MQIAVNSSMCCLRMSSVQRTPAQAADWSAAKWSRALSAVDKAKTRCVAQIAEAEPACWVHVLLVHLCAGSPCAAAGLRDGNAVGGRGPKHVCAVPSRRARRVVMLTANKHEGGDTN